MNILNFFKKVFFALFVTVFYLIGIPIILLLQLIDLFLLNGFKTLLEQRKYRLALKMAKLTFYLAKIYSFNQPHHDVARGLDGLGLIYQSLGRLEEAEQYLLQSNNMIKQLCPNPNEVLRSRRSQYHNIHTLTLVATNLNNLGLLYQSIGDLEKAKKYLSEANAMMKELFSGNYPDLARSFNNLGNLFLLSKQPEDLEKAKEYFSQANILFKNLFEQKNHIDLAIHLNSFGILFTLLGEFDRAITYYTEGLKIIKKLYPEANHPEMAIIYNNLGCSLYSQTQFNKEAEKCLLNANSILQKLKLEKTIPEQAVTIYDNLGNFYARQKNYNLALSYFRKVVEIDNEIIKHEFGYSSTSNRNLLIKKKKRNLDRFLTIVYTHFSNSPQTINNALDFILKRKGIIAYSQVLFNQNLYSKNYHYLQEKFKKLCSLKEQRVYLAYKDEYLQENYLKQQELLEKVIEEHNSLEKELTSQIPELKQLYQFADRNSIALKLPNNSALIEFIHFDLYDFEQKKWDRPLYLAFILNQKQAEQVKMISFDAEHIDKLISIYRAHISFSESKSRCVSSLTDLLSNKKKNNLILKEFNPNPGLELYQALFNPIWKIIGDKDQLFLSPDGQLNLVPFAALATDTKGNFLIDKIAVNFFTSGRDIIGFQIEVKRPVTKPLLIGDPDFNLSSTCIDNQQETDLESSSSIFTSEKYRSWLQDRDLESLEGTRIVISKLAQKFQVNPYYGKEAVEPILKAAKCPSFLMIATHGVFAPYQGNEPLPESISQSLIANRFYDVQQQEEPLLRSFLALAGANIWRKKGQLPEKAGKGVVFAQDLLALDLWKTEIVILNACQTGLGEVVNGEGVYGLRYAFSLTGAKTLVMSLYSVPDLTTPLLMESLLYNLEDKKLQRHQALREAQKYVKNITVAELLQFDLGKEIIKQKLGSPEDFESRIDALITEQGNVKPLIHPENWGAWICQGFIEALPS